MNKLILASGSPRRKELLEEAGYNFGAEPSDYEEDMTQELRPNFLVQKLSKGKALDIAKKHTKGATIVLGADTIVVFDGKVIGKPTNKEDAAATLSMLSGNEHSVYTGVTLVDTTTYEASSFAVETKIRFRVLADEEISAYIASGEPMDKAGSYGIQAGAKEFVESIDGDITNVIGLPMDVLTEHLDTLGIVRETK